ILVKYLSHLQKEYNFWMNGSDQLNTKNPSLNRVVLMRDGNILNHYWNKNDFATIHTTDIIPVDLNCLLVNLEKTIAKSFRLSGNIPMAEKFETLAYRRSGAIETYCWNEKEGFYFDYDYIENRQKDSFTVAAAFPLFFEIASKAQADKVAKVMEEKLLFPGGFITTN